jgi:ATP-dependent RNA helicase DDX56/DBP9
VQHLEKHTVQLSKSLDIIVLDEADLILSYGYQEDVEKVAKHLPKICQGFMMSATLSPEVEGLKKLILHTPVLLRLEEEEKASNLIQYAVQVPEDDKYLLLYVLLKMKLIRGKTIVFVNDINRCFKLKLFLDRMALKSAVLNSELPQNSRQHTIEQFNRGVFDLLIASDEKNRGDEDEDDEEASGSDDEVKKEGESDDEESSDDDKKKKNTKSPAKSKNAASSKKSKRQDDEYGVSRGMDFQDVICVVNFDFPRTSSSYVHRIGRTARAGKAGVSLSFLTDDDLEVARKVEVRLARENQAIKPYTFKMSVIEGFRYRVDDVLRSVTKQAIKEARFQEVKLEMLNSDKLKSFFEENPRDLDTLKHTKALLTTRRFDHLKTVPGYMVPKKDQEDALPALADPEEEYHAHFGYKKPIKKRNKRKRDPLKDFSYVSKPEKAKRSKKSPGAATNDAMGGN